MKAEMDGNMIFILGDSFTNMVESDDYIILDPKDLEPKALREIESYIEDITHADKMWDESRYNRDHPIRHQTEW